MCSHGITEAVRAIKDGNPEEVDAAMLDYFRENREMIVGKARE